MIGLRRGIDGRVHSRSWILQLGIVVLLGISYLLAAQGPEDPRAAHPDTAESAIEQVELGLWVGMFFAGFFALAGIAVGRSIGKRAADVWYGPLQDEVELGTRASASGADDVEAGELLEGMHIAASHVHMGQEAALHVGRDLQSQEGGLEVLALIDPGYSRVVLLETLRRRHREALALVGQPGGAQDPRQLAVVDLLRRLVPEAQKITDVVYGHLEVVRVEAGPAWVSLAARIETLRCVHTTTREDWHVAVETWHFRRRRSVDSVEPAQMLEQACPECGVAAAGMSWDGQCTTCGSLVQDTQQWLVRDAEIRVRLDVPDVSHRKLPDQDTPDPPLLADPDLPAQLRALSTRHPEFDPRQLDEAVRTALTTLTRCRNQLDPEPYAEVTTPLEADRLRFELARLAAAQRRVEEQGVRLLSIDLSSAHQDAWHEEVTVRVAYTGVKTVFSGPNLVGGNPAPRRFFEYWTFVHPSGQPLMDWKLSDRQESP